MGSTGARCFPRAGCRGVHVIALNVAWPIRVTAQPVGASSDLCPSSRENRPEIPIWHPTTGQSWPASPAPLEHAHRPPASLNTRPRLQTDTLLNCKSGRRGGPDRRGAQNSAKARPRAGWPNVTGHLKICGDLLLFQQQLQRREACAVDDNAESSGFGFVNAKFLRDACASYSRPLIQYGLWCGSCAR
jgi:hypothetical protein